MRIFAASLAALALEVATPICASAAPSAERAVRSAELGTLHVPAPARFKGQPISAQSRCGLSRPRKACCAVATTDHALSRS